MTRLQSTANQAAAAAAHVPYVLFADLDFSTGHVYLSTWDQNFTFGGNTYIGIGKFANLSDYEESTDLTSAALTLTLSGVDSDLVSAALASSYRGRSATIYVAYLDASNNLVDTPEVLHDGIMDTMPIHADQGQSSISITSESRLLLLGKKAGWMYTDVHQKQFFPSDNFFNLVASLANKIILWGAPTPASATVTAPQGGQGGFYPTGGGAPNYYPNVPT